MYKVVKRDGKIVEPDLSKITNAIKKAFEDSGRNYYENILDLITLRVTADYEKKIKDNLITVEDIQDSVIKVLADSGYEDVSKKFADYRQKRELERNSNTTTLNYKKTIESYLKVSDWRVKENSTVTYSVGGLILSNSGAMTANYWLSEIYDKEIAEAHRSAAIHLHDLSMLTGYCFTGDTRVLTPDGKNPSFEELVNQGVEKLQVYSYDVLNRTNIVTTAVFPRITRTTKELIKVFLPDDEVITCTPDHPFLLSNGTFVEAKHLTKKSRLRYYSDAVYATKEEKERHYLQVVGTELITLDEEVPVYDLTVPTLHNFALATKGVVVHNCAGWSLKQLIQEGLGGVPGKITSAPAKHLSTLCNQMVNFLGILQNEWAG